MAKTIEVSGVIAKSKSATFTGMSDEVGIGELRRNLSAYLRRVADGERIIVTDRNRPVAEIGPPTRLSPVLDRLIAEGKAIPPRRRHTDFEPLETPGPPNALTDALLAVRAEERW
jgi:prevent-host-death family protein